MGEILSKALQRLKQFALALDSIDSETLKAASVHFHNLVVKGLKASYYEVCMECSGDAGPILITKWCYYKKRIGNAVTVLNEEGKYFTQKAYCYANDCKLWVTPKNENDLLKDCKEFSKLLIDGCNDKKLPEYTNHSETGISKTSIIRPMNFANGVKGVFLIEFDRLDLCTDIRKDFFADVVETISTIFTRFQATESSNNDTRDALHLISELSTEVNYDDFKVPGQLPTVFFAYPSNTDKTIVHQITTLISKEYQDKLILIDWQTMTNLGSISAEIINSIRESNYGLCYFSEKLAGNKYRDNPNVLFEAGMMHMLHNNRDDKIYGWLPIREHESISGNVPFDFAGERILVVPRNNKNELNKRSFNAKFRDLLNELIGL